MAAADPLLARAGQTAPSARPATAPVRSRLARILLMALATVSLGVAALGVVTPGLPSTEFVLLAAWAAARSSPRFHAWLLRHRLFGPMLNNWQNGQRLSRRAKWLASLSMAVCSALLITMVPHPWPVAVAIACMLAVQVWLWRRPEPGAVKTSTADSLAAVSANHSRATPASSD